MLALSQCPGILSSGDASAALQAALNLKQPLAFDCDVTCVQGSDPTKSVFVPDGSDVTFMPGGRLNVDASGFPALAFLNANAIWRGLQMRYTGAPNVAMPHTPNVWTDGVAKKYLAAQGALPLLWSGPTNMSGLIAVAGASNVTLEGGRQYVDDGVTADRFASVGVNLNTGYAPNSSAAVLPTFNSSDFEMDGIVMGYVGGGAAINLTNVTRRRYADLQDAAGGTVGGVGTWMSPPHWMYFSDTVAVPMGVITIKDAIDLAVFQGAALRRPTGSGYINVIKMPLCNGSSIDGLYSRCPDGGIGILSGAGGNGLKTGGKIRNFTSVYDSSIKSSDGKGASTTGIFWPNAAASYPASDIEMIVHDRAGSPSVFATPNVPGMTVNVTVAY